MEISNLIKKVPENADMFPVATASGGNARVTLQQIALAIKPAIAMTDTERAQLTSAYNAVADLPPGKDVTDYVTGVVGPLETRVGALRVLPFDGEYFDGGATPTKGIYYHRIARDDSGEFLCFGQTTFADYGLSEDDYDPNKIPYQLYVRDNELYRVREDTGIMESFTDVAKMQNFIDRWNRRCHRYYGTLGGDIKLGGFNENTRYFELNGITNITYQEAVLIDLMSPDTFIGGYSVNRLRAQSTAGDDMYVRTFLPTLLGNDIDDSGYAFMGQEKLEAVSFLGRYPYAKHVFNHPQYMFSGCAKLKKILTPINFRGKTTNAFAGCAALEEVSLELSSDISFADSPKLSYTSVEYFVKHSPGWGAPAAGITVTVHPDVYAKLTGDTTNAAAAALSTEEAAQWQQVVTDAAAKNISFATV